MADFAAARRHMVECQIRTNKVTDRAIIDAMMEIPRERFVNPEQRGVAYLDEDLPLGGGRHLIEPMVLARMLQEAEIGPDDVVLDIGGGSGYSAAIISHLASTVIAVETGTSIVQAITEDLADLGIDNVAVVEGELNLGYSAQAPYDVILLEGAVSEVPGGITKQLADGGRLCAVVTEDNGLGRATLMVRNGAIVSSRILFDANTPALPGFEKEAGFVF